MTERYPISTIRGVSVAVRADDYHTSCILFLTAAFRRLGSGRQLRRAVVISSDCQKGQKQEPPIESMQPIDKNQKFMAHV